MYVHSNGHYSLFAADITTSIIEFSILSPGVSLSYDHIKQRLEEDRNLLASYLDIIRLATENGKTDFPQASYKMEQFLDWPKISLQDVAQSRDVSELVVLPRLRDLVEVLDNLKLYDECRLMGNCALGLAEALGRRSIEFRYEKAETLALLLGSLSTRHMPGLSSSELSPIVRKW